MTTSTFLFIVAILLLAIGVVSVLLLFSGSRFKKTKYKDEFRTRKQVGKQNVGKTKKKNTYRQIAKDKNLSEAKKLKKKINPKVTRSIAKVTKDVRAKD